MSTLTSSVAWKALVQHKEAIATQTMRDMFAADPGRFARMSREACGVFVDYSKHRATDETLELLLALARQQGVESWRDRMFAGEKTQHHREPQRAARRAAQPQQSADPVDGKDVMPEVNAVLAKMRDFTDRSAPARGKATPARRSPTSSTSASAARTSVR